MSSNKKIIAVDFDGTCVKHGAFPALGEDAPWAVEVLKRLVDAGHELILWTIRSGDSLVMAVDWFASKGIPLKSVNVNPAQAKWSSSPKVYAHHFIDDAAIGCPLVRGEGRDYVDWVVVEIALEYMGILEKTRRQKTVAYIGIAGDPIPSSAVDGFSSKDRLAVIGVDPEQPDWIDNLSGLYDCIVIQRKLAEDLDKEPLDRLLLKAGSMSYEGVGIL